MNKIILLKGPDRVRKRPSVVFGSDGAEGAFYAFKALANVLARQAILGHCRKISVTAHSDGSLSIHSEDRGMILDESIVDSKPLWQSIFCDFYAEPRELDENYFDALEKSQDSLYGYGGEVDYPIESNFSFDLCCVQYVSKFMTVESVRKGIMKTISFKEGYPSQPLKKCESDKSDGTTIDFMLDSVVFSDIKIPCQMIDRYLQVLAITVRGLTCELYIEKEAISRSYHYPDGIVDYLEGKCYYREVESDAEYKARVRLAVQFSEKAGYNNCFHNYSELECSSTHLDRVRDKIKSYLKKETKDVDSLMEHLTIVIETNCPLRFTSWINGRRNSISNKLFDHMAADLIDSGLIDYLREIKAL